MDEQGTEPPEMQASKKRSLGAMGRAYEEDGTAAAMSKQERHRRQQQQRQPPPSPPRAAAASRECSGVVPAAGVACNVGRQQQPANPREEATVAKLDYEDAWGERSEGVAAVSARAEDGGAADSPTGSQEKRSVPQAKDGAADAAGAGSLGLPLSSPAKSVPVSPPATFERPLSPDDIRNFEEDGFVMLKRAFEPEIAAACRECLWKRLHGEGIHRDRPDTWVRKQGIAEIYGTSTSAKRRRGYPWKDALSERLTSAVDQLAGNDKWEEFGCGWWMVTFPGFAQPPWGAEGKWHIDGAHFRHYPHSREIGILPIFLFSDVRPQGGGTAVLRGSHKKVAEILWNRAGTTGLTGPQLSGAARAVLLPPAREDVIETTGEAGDVLLTHPLLLHARSTNLAPVEEAGVRFMCHPAVPLKCHMDLHSDPDTFTVLERVMWHARPALGSGPALNADTNGGVGADACVGAGAGRETTPISPVIPTPAECDHSPVELRSMSKVGQIRGKGKKGRRKGQRGGQGRGAAGAGKTQQQGEHQRRQEEAGAQLDASEGQPQEKKQKRQQHAATPAEHGQACAEVGRHDSMDEPPGEKIGSPTETDAPAAVTANHDDAEGPKTPDSKKIDSFERERDESDDMAAHASEALEEVDADVLAAMGFGGFGGARR